MKFVALVSGGKDSCFNILHCLAQGHELVCLANLYPPTSDNDEIDSYMYQTVGHDVLTLYEKCIGKPMYRQPILGSSSNQKLEYSKTANDETEDLFRLLTEVIKNHPDIEAVSVGAILSSYQRTRVEDVCFRLGLTSLAYLWQRDQADLMNEMCNSGMDARIVKVAAIGLDETNLNMTLQQIRPKLIQLNQKFGVHICGEGGEFETSVLDAPFFEFGRIEILEKTVVKHTNDDVWYLKIKVGFVEKPRNPSKIEDWSNYIVEPPLLHEKFQSIYEDNESFEKLISNTNSEPVAHIAKCFWKANVFKKEDKIYVSNLFSDKENIEDQIAEIFENLQNILTRYELSFSNIQSSKLLVRDMRKFNKINSLYVKYFTDPLPPARICVETNLPESIHAQLSVVILSDIKTKSGLHVQGRSYWAPCNIGPYSQAIADANDNIIRISGQIPLIPKNMQLSCGDRVLNAVLSLQHYDSVAQVTGYQNHRLTICFIKFKAMMQLVSSVFDDYISKDENNEENTRELVIVQVTELPRGADIEWGGLFYKEQAQYMSYDSDSETEGDAESDSIKEGRKKVRVHFVEKLSEFDFGNSPSTFYEIYGNPEKITDTEHALELCPGYEIFPVVQAFDRSTGLGDRIAIVEMK